MVTVLVGVASAIVLAMTPVPRQVVQGGPTGPLAVSKSGYVAVVDPSSALHVYHLASRTLVTTVPASALNDGAGLVHPVLPTWDDATDEVLLSRGGDLLAVSVDGTRRTRPYNVGRLWPIGGTGAARWITRVYGDAEVRDAAFGKLGTLAASDSIAAAADGKSAVVATKDALVRFTLDPVAKGATIALPAPPSHGMTGNRLAVTSDGTTAVVCLDVPTGQQAVLVRHLDRQPQVTPIAWSDMIGCEIALAELHGVVVLGSTGEIRGFDLASGALRWQAPREYGIAGGLGSAIAVHHRTVLVSWRGLLLLDVVRGDVIGQLGTEIAKPVRAWFLQGNQLLALRRQDGSVFAPPRVALSRWSLTDGTRLQTGTADWSARWSMLGEDGALATLRAPNVTPGNPCWTFARGTAGDGAPAGKATTGSWPPSPNNGKAVCIPERAQVVGASLVHGSLAVFDNGKHQIVPLRGPAVTLDNAPTIAAVLEFSPDARWVAGGLMHGDWASLHVWDTRTGAHRWFAAAAGDPETAAIGGPPRKGYSAFAFSADSQQVAVAGSDTVTVYAVTTRKPLRTFTLAGSTISAVALAPTGAVIVGTTDGRLAVSRGSQLAVATSAGGELEEIAVRADGKRAASVSADGALRLWDLGKPALLVSLIESTDGESFASTPNGAYAGGREAAEALGWVFDAPVEGFKFERFANTLARPDIVTRRLADATTDLALQIARPPRLVVTRHPPPVGDRVALGLRVDAGVGKVASVRAFVNGRTAATVAVDAPTKELVLDVPLEAGSNVVTLVAFDDAGRSSNPTSVDIGMPLGTARPDVWVVAAGVGWYPNLPVEDQLEGSVNDAYAIADVFAGQAGPGKRYERAHVTVLEDEQVTAEALDQALAQLAKMRPTDVAVVFLAGHGVRLPRTDDMVLLTGTAKLDKATWATSGIGWSRIGAALAKAKGRVIVLLDACHAGNVTQERIVPNTQLADDLVGSQRAGVLVFAASKGSQKSLEANAARSLALDPDQQVLVAHKRVPKPKAPPPPPPRTPTSPRERRGNGYFTGAVVAALDSPVTDINRDGVIQTAELITQVQLRVLRASRGQQTPWVARRELFGDFALATATK